MNESTFFQDLAILMTMAGFISAVFARLKWPKVIGYILGGIILSGHTWGGSFLTDPASVRTIGQLGVVFLMFSMGLGFSTREIRRLKSVTFPVALVDTVVMMWLGYTIGTRVFGWGVVASLFLGAAVCDSATTMLAKVIGEMKWTGKTFVRFAIGTSVCEDIITVGIIALVTGVAATGGVNLAGAAFSLGGLAVFFLAVLVFGLVLVPRLLLSVAGAKDDESLVLTVLGCLFFISFIAYRFEFSLALGAFLVGILAAASDVRRRLYDLVAPLKSMFAAVFFVSVGLLVDPAACLRHAPAILALSLVVILGKFISCTCTAVLAGEKVKTAIQIGMTLAQIGEFAFMVALLYLSSTGDWTSPMYQIVVAVSLVTTLLNPFLIRSSEPFSDWALARLPSELLRRLDAYRSFVLKYRENESAGEERALIHRAIMMLIVAAMLFFAVATACGMLGRFDYSRLSPFLERYDWVVFFLAANFFAFALLPIVLKYARQLGAAIARVLAAGEAKWLEGIRHAIALAVVAAVVTLYGAEVVMLNVNLAPTDPLAASIVTGVLVVAALLGWRGIVRASSRAAARFNEALKADERLSHEEKLRAISASEEPDGRILLAADSPAVGVTVGALDIRARTGVSIVFVAREGRVIRNIGPDFVLRALDTLGVLGSGEQLTKFKALITKGEGI